MKKYIWLNPVTTTSLEKSYIDYKKLLKDEGFIYVSIDSSLINSVREDYVRYCTYNNKTIIDSRCPKAIEVIKKEYPYLCKNIAPIDPIFINCAKYLFKKWVANDSNAILFMIAPCTSLCNHGNALFKNDVIFLTWLDFCKKNNIDINLTPQKTPIPLGFFDNTNLNVLKLTGKSNIINNINKVMTNDTQDLIEILYCKDGCHNGDGI